ncbi:uncharacterized protein BP5553_07610 [Venustampulla echinocandica]|uniref:Reverse transcriptase domain-containing protein n=1 Tax=Venustampulla echinocandica TaxID=2656787 RepID=A0A370TH08_9HELO|nr:uncharacterized protein BP5553_07610 [Venustampulla echinocandica]RDL34482.1 hypothetical protein BP5553_07610 [Venustampulla echinocandica]
MILGEELWPRERDLIVEMLFKREKAIAFDFSECGRVSGDVCPLQEIRIIPHEAWQSPGFPVPKYLRSQVVEMLEERIKAGTLEYCHGLYRNQWFLVKKKSGAYRIVDTAMKYNAVTIRDANLPPNIDEISDDFAAFMTPLGLLRHTTLVQGATNSVVQFIRVRQTIFKDYVPARARIFIDDIPVLGLYSKYGDEEEVPGIRRFVLEYVKNLDLVLADIERAGATIGPKSQFGVAGLKFVGFPTYNDQTEVRAFLGVCVYYRIWILSFATKAELLYQLLKKGAVFVWIQEHDTAMDQLKLDLTTAPVLARLDVSKNAGLIILGVDASLKGWGMVLM